ncbi:MAG: hypothetical protein PF693_14470 [Spirochaetia bacterium]|nr:hypothetical protein [Spirochaetia bacterium]
MTDKKYYGFHYESGKSTTSGSPNQTTGRYNIAGAIYVFNKKENADKWVELSRKSVLLTKSELRNKCLGISVQNFNWILKNANCHDEGE